MNFVNPLFLLGLIAAGVPILLHLRKRERSRRIEFPTLMFLRKISRKTIRYQKLRHLLLLLLRVLAFVCLVLAFMRPFRSVPTQAAGAPGRPSRATVILLDNSLSMSYADRWSRARKAAADVVRDAQAGDKVAVVSFSDRSEAIFPLSGDFAGALGEIDRVELSDRSTRYAQALKAGEQILLNATTGRRIICLVSDFQKTGWATDEQEFRLGPGIGLEKVDLGSDTFSNLAFGDVHIVESNQTSGTGAGLTVKATIVNHGNQDRPGIAVSLLVDGHSVAEQKIAVSRNSTQGVEFTLPGLTAGEHPMTVVIDDPQLTRDNHFDMMVQARGRTPVLLIDRPGQREGRPESYFLSRALNVSALSHYQLTVSASAPLDSAGPIPARILIWNAGTGVTPQAQIKMQDFVRGGGGLVLVIDDPSRAGDFNRVFGSWLPVKAVEAGGPARETRPDSYVLMTNVKTEHPIFQPFGEPHSGTFSTARFFRHVRLELTGKGDVPARFDNGDPAIIAVPFEKGRVLVFPSSIDDAWNDLPLKAVYAPFWQQMLHYLENFQESRLWVEVGDTVAPRTLLIESALKQGKGNIDLNQPVVVVDPERQRIPAAATEALSVDKAGFYEIRTLGLTSMVAVNTVPRESDLGHGNSEEMVAGWISKESAPARAALDSEPLTPEQEDQRQRLWVYWLIAAFGLLIAENVLGNKSVLKSEP
jgi:hypothetical protein